MKSTAGMGLLGLFFTFNIFAETASTSKAESCADREENALLSTCNEPQMDTMYR